MAKWAKVVASISGVAAAALTAGFFAFASSVLETTPEPTEPADGIVVLTGGQARVKEALKLLQRGKAQRLLISGMHRSTKRRDLERAVRLKDSRLFDCCIDFGYEALDTLGNAAEARAWATSRGYKKLIVVTSSYHMPRGLAELRQAMPGVTLIAYPIVPRQFHAEAWWAHGGTFRLMVTEYLKYIPAIVRQKTSEYLAGSSEGRNFAIPPAGANGAPT